MAMPRSAGSSVPIVDISGSLDGRSTAGREVDGRTQRRGHDVVATHGRDRAVQLRLALGQDVDVTDGRLGDDRIVEDTHCAVGVGDDVHDAPRSG